MSTKFCGFSLKSGTQSGFRSKPTLLWYTPQLGLDTETGMEFLSLLGIVISLLSMTYASWRNDVTFFVLWFLYFSLYQVTTKTKAITTVCNNNHDNNNSVQQQQQQREQCSTTGTMFNIYNNDNNVQQ